ncbi:Helix-turn-helix [Anaerobium acetethylicum]|uniref:Helix-turn-helix n=2 Tax=Anaerobium acetethylicum TaxID=1619234 RepID=A0A1D3TUY8_9FIRM|nr:Helix-turn-helix [Anaerobium acetethylicum]
MSSQTEEIGKRIREQRKAKGLSQTELAKMLEKSLRTIQKYENGEIEPSLAMIHALAKNLDTTATYLIGYQSGIADIKCLADIMEFLFRLDEKADINFEINVEKPKYTGKWRCSITFDGDDPEAPYNASMCLFLEEFANQRESLKQYWLSLETYRDWENKTSAYYSDAVLKNKEFEELDLTTRLKRRNALINERFPPKPSAE